MILLAGIGWANPVQVNLAASLKQPKTDMAWIVLAGPFTNVVLAAFCSTVPRGGAAPSADTCRILRCVVPALRGGHINALLSSSTWCPFRPRRFQTADPDRAAKWYRALLFLEQYGVLILFFLIVILGFGRTVGTAAGAIMALLGVR